MDWTLNHRQKQNAEEGRGLAEERPLTVSELSNRILWLLEGQIGQVTVVGEVSNVRTPASGHCYFMLKDAGSSINAVCFRNTFCRQSVKLRDGLKIEARGHVTAYIQRSEYQIIIESMREAGLGDLMRQFLELKEKLKAEGLFEAALKRPIPRLPRAVGIVTSSTGAALRDMLNVLRRRVRGIEIFISPAAVQGEHAPGEIVEAIERLQRHARAEVIIVGRGGGSIEDLWAFNDERVVRAIAACSIPVISAVGHETDTTLSDYAADLRAPTPSAAAELVSAHYGETAELVAQYQRRLTRCLQYLVADRRARLTRCVTSWGLRKPQDRLNLAAQQLDDLTQDLEVAIERGLIRRESRLDQLSGRLERANPLRRVEQLRSRLDSAQARLAANGPARWTPQLTFATRRLEQLCCRLTITVETRLKRDAFQLEAARRRLLSASPEAILQRGYSIVTKGRSERTVTRPEQVRAGEVVHIRSAGGRWRAAALPPEEDLFDQIDE